MGSIQRSTDGLRIVLSLSLETDIRDCLSPRRQSHLLNSVIPAAALGCS